MNIARPDRLAHRLATGVVLGLPLLLVLEEWAAAVTPGYSRVGQTISELSAPGTPYPVLIHAAFISNGMLVLALGVAVARVLGHHWPGRLTALFLLLYGAAYLISGLFPDDSERRLAGRVTENLVHDMTAQAGVGAVMAALVGPLLADWWQGYHGLFERVMFLVTLAWVELLALRVRRAAALARYHGAQTMDEVRD